MAVPVSTSPTFQAGTPDALFSAPIWGGGGGTNNVHRWDVMPDGKRFLINMQANDSNTLPMTVVLNWTSLLMK